MSAVRLARGFTGRSKIIKFAGCYHGHVDALLAAAGSGVATFALPDSAGVTAATTGEVIVLPYNDIDAVRAAFADPSGRDRRRDHRGRPGQHGSGSAAARIQRGPGRARPRRRRAADQRRGDDRVPGVTDRPVRARRRHRGLGAGPDDVRQGDRRRSSGRRVRRTGRRHGPVGADRAGLPGRHAVREPGHHGRRPGDLAARRRRGVRATGRGGRHDHGSDLAPPWTPPVCHT